MAIRTAFVGLLFLMVGSVAGCARTHWVNDNPQADFRHDKAICKYQADIATPYSPIDLDGAFAAGMREGQLERECLQAAGWQPASAD